MKGIMRKLRRVEANVNKSIAASARSGGMYAAGLAGEGYAGGYRDAISDVMLALRGVNPNDRGRGWWIERTEGEK